MAKKTIYIDFTKSSTSSSGKQTSDINLAIKACRQILSNARRKAGSIVEEVADRIAKEARLNFQNAQYDGDNDVRVYFEKGNMATYVPYHGSPNSFGGQYALTSEGNKTQNPNAMAQRIVRFEGSALYFIEFGTGVHYNPSGSTHEWLHSYGTIGRAFKGIYPIGQYRGEDGKVKGNGNRQTWYFNQTQGETGHIVKYKKKDGTPVIATHGNPPNRCIFNAVQSVKKELPQIFATAKYAVYY